MITHARNFMMNGFALCKPRVIFQVFNNFADGLHMDNVLVQLLFALASWPVVSSGALVP
jgi:hypothetical protein